MMTVIKLGLKPTATPALRLTPNMRFIGHSVSNETLDAGWTVSSENDGLADAMTRDRRRLKGRGRKKRG